MKKQLIKLSFLLLAGMAFLTPSAKATLTYTNGDLFLGFNASGGTGVSTDYLVDIGSITNYITTGSYATGAIVTVSLSGVNADLSATYGGSNWATRTDLYWGVAGTTLSAFSGYTKNTVWATAPEISGTSTPWTRGGTSAQSATATTLGSGSGSVGGVYATGSATANNTVGTLQTASTTGSWAYFQPTANGGSNGTQSFNTYNGGIETLVSSGNVLDLYSMSTGSGSGTLLGGFQLQSNGTLLFSTNVSNFNAVPEPSTYALFVGGALALFLVRRSQKKSVKA